MTAKATSLVGLDVHARETHAAILHLDSGELAVSRLRMAPLKVVGVLERLGPGVVALPRASPQAPPWSFASSRVGSNSSIGLPDGSSTRICLPPTPVTMSLRK